MSKSSKGTRSGGGAAGSLFAVLLVLAAPTLAADDRTCRDYADRSVQQARMGQEKGCPGLVPPVWSEDGALHYTWCLLVDKAQVEAGLRDRQQVLSTCEAPRPRTPTHLEMQTGTYEVLPRPSPQLEKAQPKLEPLRPQTSVTLEKRDPGPGPGPGSPAQGGVSAMSGISQVCDGKLVGLERVWESVQGTDSGGEVKLFCSDGKAPVSWGHESVRSPEQWLYPQSHPWDEGGRKGWRFRYQVNPLYAQGIPGDKGGVDPRRAFAITFHLLCARCETGAGSERAVADRALGQRCRADQECVSNHCVDEVCCDDSCEGTCLQCDNAGRCLPLPAGSDPNGECLGSGPSCQGACNGKGQCEFPAIGARCGLCKACDGDGRCVEKPIDDFACGASIDCDGLDSACRDYYDLTGERCAAFGMCKKDNDPATCTRYTSLPCSP